MDVGILPNLQPKINNICDTLSVANKLITTKTVVAVLSESLEHPVDFSLEERITKIIFDPKVAPKKVNLDPKFDLITASAVNFYEGVTQKEAEAFYKDANKDNGDKPVMAGLNTKLVKENGVLVEKTWKLGGMYTGAIEKIVFWLEKAVTVADNDLQKDALTKLITFYKSGSLKDFDTYSIAWAKDTQSAIDVVNGFIEVYNEKTGTLRMDLEYQEKDEIMMMPGIITSLAVSSDSEYLCSGTSSGEIMVWRLSTGRCLKSFRVHKESITALSFSKDSSQVISSSNDSTIRYSFRFS
jgi:hypothetical protein